MKITEIWREFMQYKVVEEEICEGTVVKYEDCIKRFVGLEGDLDLENITLEHFTDLRFNLQKQKISAARISSIIFCLRSLLRYCRERKDMQVLDPMRIKTPRKRKREIVYMDNSEVSDFLEAIDLTTIYGLRMRTLCEVLLDTGGRISEVLQLNRSSFRWNGKTWFAKITAKGDKERRLYVSEHAMYWIKQYLERRTDKEPALFITHPAGFARERHRMKPDTLYNDFKRVTNDSGVSKKITQHILRHTFCSNLVQNGANIYNVKELAGHEDIKTTVNYYAALNDNALIETKETCLNYEVRSTQIAY
ncbi:MAG: tyrosine-type recombinase/integrase [Bacteroidales bacterium]|nr:tyrosine-type recombinase/integrase [Bacteroidales bacterium]